MSGDDTKKSKRVFILGAGFSRALFSKMPLTDELGDQVLRGFDDTTRERHMKRAGLKSSNRNSQRYFKQGTFEEYLSRLAEDQPDLDPAENFCRRAMFAEVSDAVSRVIQDAQQGAWKSSRPGQSSGRDYIGRLVAVLHAWRATTITFNYDSLVEQAVDEQALWPGYDSENQRVLHASILDQHPPEPSDTGVRFGYPQADTFKLLKLHGSINWFWDPQDPTGASLKRWSSTLVNEETPQDKKSRERLLFGLVPFIIPPSALKSTYYANSFTRALWRQAAQEIAGADTLYLVGYGLPQTDLAVSGMLRERLKENTRIVVVNKTPGPVQEQLARCGVPESQIEIVTGDDSVQRMIAKLEQERSIEVGDVIREASPDEYSLATLRSGNTFATVRDVSVEGDKLVLNCNSPGPEYEALGSIDIGTPQALGSACLVEKIRGSTSMSVMARLPDGGELTVVDMAVFGRETGQSPSWWALYPSRSFACD
jgi:hypothetical protein